LRHSRNLLKAQRGFHGFELRQGARIHRELVVPGNTMNSDDTVKTAERISPLRTLSEDVQLGPTPPTAPSMSP
jgi:hypothetical protein